MHYKKNEELRHIDRGSLVTTVAAIFDLGLATFWCKPSWTATCDSLLLSSFPLFFSLTKLQRVIQWWEGYDDSVIERWFNEWWFDSSTFRFVLWFVSIHLQISSFKLVHSSTFRFVLWFHLQALDSFFVINLKASDSFSDFTFVQSSPQIRSSFSFNLHNTGSFG
jgi:hypothetical protein